MKIILTFLLSLTLLGCSTFQKSTQDFTVAGQSKSNDKVFVNDRLIYSLPSTIQVDRDKSVTVNVVDKDNNLVYTKTVSPVLSTTGKLDTMGVYFLFPGIGLFTPGAYELDANTVVFHR